MKVKNFIESLCILYLLYHWSLGNRGRCADLLYIIIKPSTTKWTYSDSSTLTYTITRHTTGRAGILPRKTINLVLFVLCRRFKVAKPPREPQNSLALTAMPNILEMTTHDVDARLGQAATGTSQRHPWQTDKRDGVRYERNAITQRHSTCRELKQWDFTSFEPKTLMLT